MPLSFASDWTTAQAHPVQKESGGQGAGVDTSETVVTPSVGDPRSTTGHVVVEFAAFTGSDTARTKTTTRFPTPRSRRRSRHGERSIPGYRDPGRASLSRARREA